VLAIGNFLWIVANVAAMVFSKLRTDSFFPVNPSYGAYLSASFLFLVFGSVFSERKLGGLVLAGLPPLTALYTLTLTPPIMNGRVIVDVAGVVSLAAVGVYLVAVDRSARLLQGHSPLMMLRAFLEAWAADTPARLERAIEKQSLESETTTKIISLDTKEKSSSLIVPGIHPGPFAHVGSSNLPGRIFASLASTTTPLILHGVSGHTLNLPSEAELSRLIAGLGTPVQVSSSTTSTKVSKATVGTATVGGIAFGSDALLWITLAPNGMEDFPDSLAQQMSKLAEARGFRVIPCDCHNSEGDFPSTEDITSVVKAAEEVLAELSALSQQPFAVGVSHSSELDFTGKSDIGPAGIGVMAFESAGSTFGFVIADANNAATGLRDKLRNRLSELGFDDAELFTSDTHVNAAKIKVEKGYLALGESTPEAELFNLVEQLAVSAKSRLSEGSFQFNESVVKVKVTGPHLLEELSSSLDRVSRVAKKGGLALAGFLTLMTIVVAILS
jgi:putative membrane protein